MRIIILLLVFVAPTFLSQQAAADWVVDASGSYVGFASVKNDVIAENHSFTRVSGTVTDAGKAVIQIELTSVETLIPIRNERMQSMLFDIVKFPVATVTSNLQMPDYVNMSIGDSKSVTVPMMVSIHGAELTRPVLVKVTRSAANSFEVSSLGPIVVSASQLTLADGIEALREIAGLQSIDLMVPVTFDLKLVQVKQSDYISISTSVQIGQ